MRRSLIACLAVVLLSACGGPRRTPPTIATMAYAPSTANGTSGAFPGVPPPACSLTYADHIGVDVTSFTTGDAGPAAARQFCRAQTREFHRAGYGEWHWSTSAAPTFPRAECTLVSDGATSSVPIELTIAWDGYHGSIGTDLCVLFQEKGWLALAATS